MIFLYQHFEIRMILNKISNLIFTFLIILQYSLIAQTAGSIDPLYLTSKYCNGPITKMISLTDGGFIAIGDFYNCNTGVHSAIVKFNSDLSVDPTFNEQVQSNHFPYALIEYPGNKFLVGGDFNRWDGDPQYSMLVMLNADGTIDASFNPEFITGTFDRVSAIAVQADGKIIVSGTFNIYGDIFPGHILRINADGSADPSFNAEIGELSSDIALDIVPLDDGDILIGGSFDEVNGVEMNGIARLNSDGSLDETFITPFTSGGTIINDIQLLPDGKIMVGGDCSILTAGVTSHQDIIRLFSDGTHDNSFTFNSSFIISKNSSFISFMSIVILAKGCLTGTLFICLSLREEETVSRILCILLNTSSFVSPALGQFVRCTLSSSFSVLSDSQTSSAEKGAKGAINLARFFKT